MCVVFKSIYNYHNLQRSAMNNEEALLLLQRIVASLDENQVDELLSRFEHEMRNRLGGIKI